jgi:hypothetical protein
MLFSQIIWKAVKGEDSEMPAPRRSAFVKISETEDEEEEEEKMELIKEKKLKNKSGIKAK